MANIRQDLSTHTNAELLDLLKGYVALTALEIAVILAELKIREAKDG